MNQDFVCEYWDYDNVHGDEYPFMPVDILCHQMMRLERWELLRSGALQLRVRNLSRVATEWLEAESNLANFRL